MAELNTSISTEDGEMKGYLATPKRPNGAAVLVLQEIFGVNSNIRSIADYFAENGYLALAPDLFWRQQPGVAIEPADDGAYDRAREFLAGMDFPKAVSDAHKAASWLAEQDSVTAKVGAVGFCMGGNIAFQLSRRPGVAGIVVYYGTGLHNVLDAASGYDGEVLVHVAEADNLCPPDAQQAIKRAGEDHPGITVRSHVGAGHAFARVGGEHYHAEAASAANTETDAFLARVLDAKTD